MMLVMMMMRMMMMMVMTLILMPMVVKGKATINILNIITFYHSIIRTITPHQHSRHYALLH